MVSQSMVTRVDCAPLISFVVIILAFSVGLSYFGANRRRVAPHLSFDRLRAFLENGTYVRETPNRELLDIRPKVGFRFGVRSYTRLFYYAQRRGRWMCLIWHNARFNTNRMCRTPLGWASAISML